MIATSASQLALRAACDEIGDILVSKNAAYGDSALDPVRIFSQASTREQLLVRIDDKLSRIARGGELGEDVVLDLIGYLVLLRVHDLKKAAGAQDEAVEPPVRVQHRRVGAGELAVLRGHA